MSTLVANLVATQVATQSPYNIYIDTLLVGRYDRRSLQLTLAGIQLSDIIDMTMEGFLGSLKERDRLIGRIFWSNLLVPLRNAWTEWEGLAGQRNLVKLAQSKLEAIIQSGTRME
jgi:hypothetical protein